MSWEMNERMMLFGGKEGREVKRKLVIVMNE